MPSSNSCKATGIDISAWQLDFVPPENPPLPIDFVFQKISDGYAVDRKLDVLWEGTKLVKNRGGYHYFRTATDVDTQVSVFLANSDGMQIAVLDYEDYGNTLNKHAYWAAKEWIDKVIASRMFYRVMLYTNKNNLILMNNYGTWHQEIPLFYAQYYLQCPDPFTVSPVLPKTRVGGWQFWQYGIAQKYGNTLNGLDFGVQSKSLDLDVFNGTKEELDVFFGTERVQEEMDSNELWNEMRRIALQNDRMLE